MVARAANMQLYFPTSRGLTYYYSLNPDEINHEPNRRWSAESFEFRFLMVMRTPLLRFSQQPKDEAIPDVEQLCSVP
ncbi:hypothetical protein ACTXT7_010456 [Hymenolepis weldensis]